MSEGMKTKQKICDSCGLSVEYTRLVNIGEDSWLRLCEEHYQEEMDWRKKKAKNKR